MQMKQSQPSPAVILAQSDVVNKPESLNQKQIFKQQLEAKIQKDKLQKLENLQKMQMEQQQQQLQLQQQQQQQQEMQRRKQGNINNDNNACTSIVNLTILIWFSFVRGSIRKCGENH